MQPADMVIALWVALGLSLAYNVYQALKRSQLAKRLDIGAEQTEQLERFRHELRNVRSELANETQVVETLKRQLSEEGKTRSTFLDHMSYFVRSPLNLIIGYSDMLMSGIYGDIPEPQRAKLIVIHRSGNDLLKYFSDMLELHRLEIGSIELKLRPVAVQPLFERVAVEGAKGDRRGAVEIKQDIEADIGNLFADEKRVEQVLTHLVSNAVRFTRKGTVTLGARTVKVKDGKSDGFTFPMLGWLRDGEWIILTVSDTGVGIPSEAQASIFETFYQVARDQTDEQKGIGLGLAIAKRLIELHRGVIWVKSSEGQGSTFFIALNTHRNIRATDTQERLLMNEAKS
jgi:signal transduction histidine kinase